MQCLLKLVITTPLGHSVKCSPPAGTFRLHRPTAPDRSYRLYDSNNISFCGRLSDHLFLSFGS
nr:MAG TPA: hypothetical protein [Caudoviricetes sp.]